MELRGERDLWRERDRKRERKRYDQYIDRDKYNRASNRNIVIVQAFFAGIWVLTNSSEMWGILEQKEIKESLNNPIHIYLNTQYLAFPFLRLGNAF